jgi:hypothetical protein
MMDAPSKFTYQKLVDQWDNGWQDWFVAYLENHHFTNDYTEVRWWELDFRDKKLWSDISSNPNLTLGTVKKFPNLPWNEFMLSKQLRITPEIYLENRDFDWDIAGICCNPCFGPEWFPIIGIDNVDWGWYSKNRSLDWSIVLQYQNKPWNWDYISLNKTLTWEQVNQRPFRFPWTWWGLSKNPNTPWSELLRNPSKWYDISHHPQLQWEYVKNYQPPPNEKAHWNWGDLSAHPNITLNIIQKNPDMPWCQSAVSKNPNVTWSIVKDNLSYNWDWANLSRNPSIKWSDIKSNPDAPWNWRYVSENPNVSWDIVQQYPDLPWNYDALVTNKMNQAKHDWIQQKRLHTIKALQLQRHWRNYSNNPQYILGKRLVLERAGYEV